MKFSATYYFFAGVLVTLVAFMIFKKTTEGFQTSSTRSSLLKITDSRLVNIIKLLIQNSNSITNPVMKKIIQVRLPSKGITTNITVNDVQKIRDYISTMSESEVNQLNKFITDNKL